MINIPNQIYTTPIKQKLSQSHLSPSETVADTERIAQRKTTSAVDYKSKTFELMNQNIQLKARQLRYQSRIAEIEKQIADKDSQISQFLEKLQCGSLQQVIRNTSNNRRTQNQIDLTTIQKSLKQLVISTKSNTISTNIASFTQQHHSIQVQKSIQQLHKKYQLSNRQLQEQNKKLRLQIKQIKEQYRFIIEQVDKLTLHNQRLKDDLKSSIDRYEEIDRVIQDKIKVYLDKIKQYEDIIASGNFVQKDNTHNHIKHVYFDYNKGQMSFGNNSQAESLAKFKSVSEKDEHIQDAKNMIKDENNYQVDCQCYKASIQGLLQQNKRLKKSFQNLYKLRQGQQIPQDLIKQINIMKSIIQLNQNIDNID